MSQFTDFDDVPELGRGLSFQDFPDTDTPDYGVFAAQDLLPPEDEIAEPEIAKVNVRPAKKDLLPKVRSEEVKHGYPILSLPSFSYTGFIDRLGGMAFKDVYHLPDTPSSKVYQRTIGDAAKVMSRNPWDMDALTNDEADWATELDDEANSPIRVGNHIVSANNNVGGEPAVLKVMTRIGAGNSRAIPLENSGFYVTIIPSKAPQLAAMMMDLLESGEDIGYRTGGVAYDLGSTFVEQEIMSHIFSNIRSSTLKDVSLDNIRDHVLASDYRRLIIGQLLATYPRGVLYDQPCIADHNTCQHIETGKINLATVLRLNRKRFSAAQLHHLRRARKEVTLADVKAFRNLAPDSSKMYVLRSKGDDDQSQVRIKLEVPTIMAAHSAYTNTVNHISTVLPASLVETGSRKQRNQFLSNQLSAVPIINHIAWISELHVGEEGSDDEDVYTDEETIRSIIEALCEDDLDDEIVTTFLEAYSDFMMRVDTTMVLMRNKPCPSCGKVVKDFEGNALEYIPLEAESLFLAITQFRLIAKGRLRQYVI